MGKQGDFEQKSDRDVRGPAAVAEEALDRGTGPKTGESIGNTERQQRLAMALRQNLQRRKAQVRERRSLLEQDHSGSENLNPAMETSQEKST